MFGSGTTGDVERTTASSFTPTNASMHGWSIDAIGVEAKRGSTWRWKIAHSLARVLRLAAGERAKPLGRPFAERLLAMARIDPIAA